MRFVLQEGWTGVFLQEKRTSVSLADQAYQAIKSQLVVGHYGIGEYIDLNAVMAELQMSRTPVREAFLRLKEEGHVEIIPKRGIHVNPVSSDKLKQLYQVITALEIEAVGALAGLGVDDITASVFTRILDQMRRAVAAEDLNEWCLADESFHRALGDHCGNPELATCLHHYRDLAQRAHFVALRMLDSQPKQQSTEAHRELITLIHTGDAEQCRLVHREQRERGARLLIEVLQKYQLKQL